MIRNRIKRHVRMRAGDLVPHELNPRRHNDAQRQALADLYRDIGFARSLLAYELPDGRLKLLDGHLRQALEPDLVVEVEVLDVNDAEGRALLLSLDPLAQLAEYDQSALEQLRSLTPTESDALANLWACIAQANEAVEEALHNSGATAKKDGEVPEQFLILIECASEEEQVRLLERFQGEGLKCKPLLS